MQYFLLGNNNLCELTIWAIGVKKGIFVGIHNEIRYST